MLEMSAIEYNKIFHDNFKKLHEKMKIIITDVYSTSTENYQQH